MGYNGQRGPNVSEFIANLNAIPSAQEMASQGQENFNLDDDLSLFTNTNFFDFDLGQDADLQPANFDFNRQSRAAPAAGNTDTKGLDFIQGELTIFTRLASILRHDFTVAAQSTKFYLFYSLLLSFR